MGQNERSKLKLVGAMERMANRLKRVPRVAAKAPPRTGKGRRTRDALVEAGREIFARDGFFGAKVTDMTNAAGLANGSFYTYFNSKEEIFREVAAAVLQESVESIHGDPNNPGRDPVRDIFWANREYLKAYQREVGMMRAIEQATPHDPQMKEMRYAHFLKAVERSERRIRRLQEAGVADRDMDPAFTALALGSMLLRVAYTCFALARKPVDLDLAVITSTKIWAKALGLDYSSIENRPPAKARSGAAPAKG